MRWLFYNPHDDAEARCHASLLDRIDAWWDAFSAKTADLKALFSRKSEWDLPEWMEDWLGAIDPRLMWEYGRAIQGDGHRLVITPETEKGLRPLCASILERAPRLEGWEFYPYRLAEGVDDAQATVEARTGGDLKGVSVEVKTGKHHRVDLTYRSPRTTGDADQQAFNDAFVATETLLGEECLDKWVGAIEARPVARAGFLAGRLKRGKPVNLIPLTRLQETVGSLIGGLRDQLPNQPCHRWVADAEWTAWELTPTQDDDYPQQSDLFVARSPLSTMWTAAHNGGLFYSERFSRCNETFCYVKLDGSEGLEEMRFADKAKIEDALDAALRPDGLGCSIGGGTGLRYSYIDLALTDLFRGVDVVRRVLRAGNMQRRSWIEFFDADMVDEWVGIYDDSPPPPRDDDTS